MALVSVVIPVFNRDPTPALKSVQGQTFRDWECIVVDDGSANDVEAAVDAMNDNRFRYVRQENRGGNAARNNGIDLANGFLVAFLDSDDRWLPKKLEIQVGQLEDTADIRCVSYCQFRADRGVGSWVRPTKFPSFDSNMENYLFVKNQFVQTSTIMAVTSVAKTVRWDESLKRGQDLDFVLRLRKFGCWFSFLPMPLVVVDDASEAGRVSRTTGVENHLTFLAKHQMGWRARLGYRATYLAYDLAQSKPLTATKDLFLGLFAGVSPLVIARQALRAFVPRDQYRKLVNSFVAIATQHRAM